MRLATQSLAAGTHAGIVTCTHNSPNYAGPRESFASIDRSAFEIFLTNAAKNRDSRHERVRVRIARALSRMRNEFLFLVKRLSENLAVESNNKRSLYGMWIYFNDRLFDGDS